jgi:hypothetical protein
LIQHLTPLPQGIACDTPERSVFKAGLCERYYARDEHQNNNLCVYDRAKKLCLPLNPSFTCFSQCDVLDSLSNVRDRGEWCNTDPVRRSSETECLGHYATWKNGNGSVMYARCFFQDNECRLSGFAEAFPQCA